MITSNLITRELVFSESGDRLSWVEFERCYQALKKADLIEGLIYVASTVCRLIK